MLRFPVAAVNHNPQEAGATAQLELAFTIADGLEYIRCAQVGFIVVAQ